MTMSFKYKVLPRIVEAAIGLVALVIVALFILDIEMKAY